MKPKLASLLLVAVFALIVQIPATAFAESNITNTGTINNSGVINNGTIVVQFIDVDVNNWAYDAITSMSSRNVVSGYEDGSFRPDNPISREEFAKMIAVTFSLDLSVTQDVYYSDIPPTRWSYPHILATKEYVTGYYPPKGQPFFDPAAKATREDVATALVKIMGLSTDKYSTHFTDDSAISPNLRKYVNVAADYHLISGYPDGTFKPLNPISRAEVAALLYRAIKGISGDIVQNHQAELEKLPDQAINIKAPDLWVEIVKESTTPELPNMIADPTSPINIIVRGETTPGATLTVNGDAVSVDRLGNYNYITPVTQDGIYSFEVKASYFNHATTVNRSITINIEPPQLVLEKPEPQVITARNPSFRVLFHWIDRADNNAPTLFVNGQKRNYSMGGRFKNGGNGQFDIALQSGQNDITIKLVNRFGKESNTVTKSVYYQSDY
ncbi:S-layer homology domain-containing protein [Paenibacillaceae bacterium WGS1546]|uniref:S-layer homology domain-containing protein n=1 Tax=Cohnella sp. WGS1546 TaxID=3366810 RepID=UPI00372D148E